MVKKIFSSESVSPGHPDKICDQISDAVLDALLRADKYSRVACEVMAKNSVIVVAGEVDSTGYVDLEAIIKKVCQGIGYTNRSAGFDMDHFSVINMLSSQSSDIAQGIGRANKKNQGAGDQGLMFGYATRETKSFMPMAHNLANQLMQKHHQCILEKKYEWLGPDAKAQVALVYEDNKPIGIHNVVLSTQHTEAIQHKELVKIIINELIIPVLPEDLISDTTEFFINPTGKFIIGGPMADCGLTGRKIIVDSYGGMARHGGGCFSGKDPSKVDRSAAYCARYIAKHIVAAGLAARCEVQLAYAIGRADPTSMRIETFGTSQHDEALLEKMVRQIFPLTPYQIIDQLELLQPIYQKTATFGHFGREECHFPWERLDRLERVQSFID